MEAQTLGSKLKNLKLLFLGSSESGKTSIINRYISNTFIENYFPTKDLM